MKETLEIKDLINIGLFSALYVVCYFAVSVVGFIPIMLLLIPLICPLVAGIPFMLFVTKVRKFGMTTIMGLIITVLMTLMGHLWIVIIFGVVCGLVCDFILKASHYKSKKMIILGYAIFSEWGVGAFLALFFGFRIPYFAFVREGYGAVYADKLMALTPNWMFYVIIVFSFVGGVIGAVLGQRVLKKHFKKAGIVS